LPVFALTTVGCPDASSDRAGDHGCAGSSTQSIRRASGFVIFVTAVQVSRAFQTMKEVDWGNAKAPRDDEFGACGVPRIDHREWARRPDEPGTRGLPP
jgi:hypothetical protein